MKRNRAHVAIRLAAVAVAVAAILFFLSRYEIFSDQATNEAESNTKGFNESRSRHAEGRITNFATENNSSSTDRRPFPE